MRQRNKGCWLFLLGHGCIQVLLEDTVTVMPVCQQHNATQKDLECMALQSTFVNFQTYDYALLPI